MLHIAHDRGLSTEHCTGTLITPRHVLTAAHCYLDHPGGTIVVDVGAVEYGVADFIGYPDYQPEQPGSDVAVVVLTDDVPDVEPIPIMTAGDVDHVARGTEVVHVGWGPTETAFTGQIRSVGIGHVNAGFSGSIASSMDLRGGDSGSPMLQYRSGRPVVVGVMFRGCNGNPSCADDEFLSQGVWLTQQRWYDWIREQAGDAMGSLISDDYDDDGIPNAEDTCPFVDGSGGADADNDNVGEVCDDCPTTQNGGQIDFDADDLGLACDNCPLTVNGDQRDQDEDGVGDACDNCVETPNAEQENSDGDGVGDACDNCLVDDNDDQANCDADDDLSEGVPFGRTGDACDPDRCIEIADISFSDYVVPSGSFSAERRVGDSVYISLRTWGGVPTGESPPSYLEDDVVADVEVDVCACEPDPVDPDSCRATPSVCEALSWRRRLYGYVDFDQGNGLIPDMYFSRPPGVTGPFMYSNSTDISWRWRDDVDTGAARAILRFRSALEGWSADKGYTFSEELDLSVTSGAVLWIPDLRLHDLWSMPPALDLSALRVCRDDCPWQDEVSQPFEMPNLVVGRLGGALDTSPFALRKTSRAAIGGLAVQRHWTGSGFTSEYLPVEFDSGEQMDLDRFATTVLLEEAPGSRGVGEGLSSSLTIWTFGGIDSSGQPHAELWRGSLVEGSKGSVYHFSLVAGGQLAPRSEALLLADVEGQRLVLLGGVGSSGLFDEIWAFELAAQKWIRQPGSVPSGVGLRGAAAYVANNRAYLYGGENKKGRVDGLWALDLATLEFQQLDADAPSPPGPRVSAALGFHPSEDALLLYGGACDDGWCNDLWSYDLDQGAWLELAERCDPGTECPTPGETNALSNTGMPWAITVSVGRSFEGDKNTVRQWRYVFAQNAWVPEVESRRTCPADCDHDGRVTISELTTAVLSALGRPSNPCTNADRNRDGRVAIDELIAGVGAALEGCP